MMPKERYIELDVTYECSARCRHCIFASSPRRGGLMSIENARLCLAETKVLGLTGADVVITGGEPLLFPHLVVDIVRAAADLGMGPVRSVQSNASWCTDDEVTRSRLTELRDAGLGGIYFSADPFHQEFVPVENVRRGVRIADDVFGPDHVAAPREYLDSDPTQTVDEYIEGLSPTSLHFVGRAARALADRMPTIPLAQILEMNCRGGRHDIDPSSVWQINVDGYGCVSSWICSGIILGNAHKTRISEIITRPIEEQPRIVQDLVNRGPAAVLDMARACGFEPRHRYVSKCHLCWEAREALYSRHPDLFGPAELYQH